MFNVVQRFKAGSVDRSSLGKPSEKCIRLVWIEKSHFYHQLYVKAFPFYVSGVRGQNVDPVVGR